MSNVHKSRWYKSGWDDERKAKQRDAIHRWRPWEKSTGPKSEMGKAQAASNGRWAYLNSLDTKRLLAAIRRI